MARTRTLGETPARALRWGALAGALLLGALIAHLHWRETTSSEANDRQWHESTSGSIPTAAPSLIGAADRPTTEQAVQPPSPGSAGSSLLAITVVSASEGAAPIPGAEVQLLEVSQAVGLKGIYLDSRTLASGRTDPAGRIDLEPRGMRPEKELLVQVRAPKWLGHVQSVGTSAGAPREIEVRLEPGLALGGSVVTMSGDAVPGVSVSARRLGRPRRTSRRLPDDLGHWIFKTKTDGRGAFSFDGLDDACYEVMVDDPGWVHLIKPRDRGEPLDEVLTIFRAGTEDRILLEVERLMLYRARFVDSATGDGIRTVDEVFVTGVVPGAAHRNVELPELTGRTQGIVPGPQRSDPAVWVGAVALRFGDAPEFADLAFTVPGYTYGAVRVHLYDPTDLARTGAVDEVQLHRQADEFGSVLVTAQLPPGVTLPEVPPVLAVVLRNGIVMFARGVETDAGAWLYTQVPTTAAEVALLCRHWIRYPVEVKRNTQTSLGMDLTKASGVVVSLESREGEPLFDAKVCLVKNDTNRMSLVGPEVAALVLDGSGVPARVPIFIDPGRYRLKAWLRGYRKAESEVTVPADGLTSVRLILDRKP